MADSSGQAEIRGLDIQKLATGFADEAITLKKYVRQSTTAAREIRWYKKTAGFLSPATTTAITSNLLANTATGAKPFVAEPSWTRMTSYVRKYFVESPPLMIEDIKDTDIDILGTMVRDLTLAVQYQVDKRIYNVIADVVTAVPGDGSTVPDSAATADGWDDTVTGDPIKDIMTAKASIRSFNYDPEGCVMCINPSDHKNLLLYLINVKGSSIPQFSTELAKEGVVMTLLGTKVLVSTNYTADYAVFFVPQVTAAWKSFTPISTAVVEEPGISKTIRVWEEGECLLENPNSAYVLTAV